jgi:hypothetical protein
VKSSACSSPHVADTFLRHIFGHIDFSHILCLKSEMVGEKTRLVNKVRHFFPVTFLDTIKVGLTY